LLKLLLSANDHIILEYSTIDMVLLLRLNITAATYNLKIQKIKQNKRYDYYMYQSEMKLILNNELTE